MSQLSSLEESCSCSICLELFVDPQMLKCGHSFCKNCLPSLPRQDKFYSCALCRKPSQDNEIVNNFQLASIVEAFKSSQRPASTQAPRNKIPAPVLPPVLPPEVLPIEVPTPEPVPKDILSALHTKESQRRPAAPMSSNRYRLHVHVRCDLASFVIGKKGHRIKKVEEDHRVRIRSLKETQRPGYVTFEICGASEDSIHAASNSIVAIQSNASRNSVGQQSKSRQISSEVGSFEVLPSHSKSAASRDHPRSPSSSHASVSTPSSQRSESSVPQIRQPHFSSSSAPPADRPDPPQPSDGPSLATIAGIVVGGVAAVAAAAFAGSVMSRGNETDRSRRNQRQDHHRGNHGLSSAESTNSNDNGCTVC